MLLLRSHLQLRSHLCIVENQGFLSSVFYQDLIMTFHSDFSLLLEFRGRRLPWQRLIWPGEPMR